MVHQILFQVKTTYSPATYSKAVTMLKNMAMMGMGFQSVVTVPVTAFRSSLVTLATYVTIPADKGYVELWLTGVGN